MLCGDRAACWGVGTSRAETSLTSQTSLHGTSPAVRRGQGSHSRTRDKVKGSRGMGPGREQKAQLFPETPAEHGRLAASEPTSARMGRRPHQAGEQEAQEKPHRSEKQGQGSAWETGESPRWGAPCQGEQPAEWT